MNQKNFQFIWNELEINDTVIRYIFKQLNNEKNNLNYNKYFKILKRFSRITKLIIT